MRRISAALALPGDERAVEVELSDAARQRFPGAEVRYRRSYLAPNGSDDSEDTQPTRIRAFPLTDRPPLRLAGMLWSLGPGALAMCRRLGPILLPRRNSGCATTCKL
jgi:hypothetical protein